MEKTIRVEGMSCGHCEASVKEALLNIDGINEVMVNLDTKEVKIKGDKIEDNIVRTAIDDIGFEVV